jgi:hypothetical protein
VKAIVPKAALHAKISMMSLGIRANTEKRRDGDADD